MFVLSLALNYTQVCLCRVESESPALPLKRTSPSSCNECAVEGEAEKAANESLARPGILKPGSPGDVLRFVAVSNQKYFRYLRSS